MTRERAIRLAEQWASGAVCTLREGEAAEYHRLCLDALRQQEKLEGDIAGLKYRLAIALEHLSSTDIIPVVRCKNCRFGEDASKEVHAEMVKCKAHYTKVLQQPDFYCALGRPKSEEVAGDG